MDDPQTPVNADANPLVRMKWFCCRLITIDRAGAWLLLPR
jgi:hypothetical protein